MALTQEQIEQKMHELYDYCIRGGHTFENHARFVLELKELLRDDHFPRHLFVIVTDLDRLGLSGAVRSVFESLYKTYKRGD